VKIALRYWIRKYQHSFVTLCLFYVN
jgi:hypothetical protein